VAESNAALASLVYKLREQLNSLQTVVNGLSAGAGAHEHPHLAKELEALAQIMQGHIEAEEERATSQCAPVWASLDREDFQAQLARVGEWVDRHLRAVYAAYWTGVLHDCWRHHPEALYELGNLWAEWNRIYDRGHPSLTGALNWHDRWMPGARARLREVMAGCRIGGCQAQPGSRR
jgi:hypothetical protein